MSTRVIELGKGRVVYVADVWDEHFELSFFEKEHGFECGSVGEPGDRALTADAEAAVIVRGPIRSIQSMIDCLLEAKDIHKTRMLRSVQ